MAVTKIPCTGFTPTKEGTQDVYFNFLTWSQVSEGKYYADIANTNKKIVSVFLENFNHLRDTDNVVPYINGSKMCMMSNTNTFAQDAFVRLHYFYVE